MAWSLASLFFFFALVLTIAATVRTLFHPEESKQYPLAAISLFAATATVAAWCYGKMHQ
jgi:hypothetical protein